MEAEVARSTVPFSGFIEIARVQVQPHNTLGDPAIDPVESVSPAHSQYGDGGRLTSLKCGGEEFRQCVQLLNFVGTHVAFVVGKPYVQPGIGHILILKPAEPMVLGLPPTSRRNVRGRGSSPA